jgi:hypothetical protein
MKPAPQRFITFSLLDLTSANEFAGSKWLVEFFTQPS